MIDTDVHGLAMPAGNQECAGAGVTEPRDQPKVRQPSH